MRFRDFVGLAGLLIAAALPGQAFAAWSEARSKHFIVYSDGSPKQLKEFAEKLEKFDFLLRTMTNVEDEKTNPVLVFALAHDRDVQALIGRNNIAGYYTTSSRHAYAVVSREKESWDYDLGADDVLFHEYAHHFMLHYFPAAYPAWYVEGFAEFYSEVKFQKDGAIQFGNVPMARIPGLLTSPIYPLDRLFARDTDKLTRMDGDRYYGTAWLLTHYFRYNAKRREEFNRYLMDVVGGVADVTIDNHFAGGTKALEKDLRNYLAARKMMATTLTPSEMPKFEVSVYGLDEAHNALIMSELRMMERVEKDKAEPLAASIRAAAVKYPQSAYAQALLAEAELMVERNDAALAAADKAIVLDPELSRAYAAKAFALLARADADGKEEDWKAARTAIVKANRTDMDDPLPLILYYRYYMIRGLDVPQVAYDGLNKAFATLPQNDDYRFLMATSLANRKQYKRAAEVLGPLAFSPHPSGQREAALKLREEFQKAEKGEIAKSGSSDQ